MAITETHYFLGVPFRRRRLTPGTFRKLRREITANSGYPGFIPHRSSLVDERTIYVSSPDSLIATGKTVSTLAGQTETTNIPRTELTGDKINTLRRIGTGSGTSVGYRWKLSR